MSWTKRTPCSISCQSLIWDDLFPISIPDSLSSLSIRFFIDTHSKQISGPPLCPCLGFTKRRTSNRSVIYRPVWSTRQCFLKKNGLASRRPIPSPPRSPVSDKAWRHRDIHKCKRYIRSGELSKHISWGFKYGVPSSLSVAWKIITFNSDRIKPPISLSP